MPLSTYLTNLDEFILDRVFQPLTDRLGEKPSAFDIGMSLELGAVVLELTADAVLFALHRLSLGAGIWDGISCACGMWFYSFMIRQRPLVRPGRPNPLRLIYRSIRLLGLAFALWSLFAAVGAGPGAALADALNTASNVIFVAGIYLISCQPRPPGWRVVKRATTPSPWAVAQRPS